MLPPRSAKYEFGGQRSGKFQGLTPTRLGAHCGVATRVVPGPCPHRWVVHSQAWTDWTACCGAVTLPPMTRKRPAAAARAAVVLLLSSLPLVAAAPPSPAGEPPVAGAPTAVVAYQSPLAGGLRVARGFDPPLRRWLPGHRGVDLAADQGAVVYAAGPGVVRFAGPVAGRPVVSIDHPNGLRTTYEPVQPLVVVGDRVAAGDQIGVLLPSHPGCPVSACLHWGLRRGTFYLDPLSLLGLGQVRLLPD